MLAIIAIVVFAVLLTLKLASVVALSWFVVCLPLILLAALWLVIVFLILIGQGIMINRYRKAFR